MSKVAADSELLPERFATLAEVMADDAVKVVEAMNYASQRIVSHLSINSCRWDSPSADDPSYKDPGLGLFFAGDYETLWFGGLRFSIVVPQEITSLLVGARCEILSGQECSVRVTVTEGFSGSSVTSSVLTFDNAGNDDEQTTTIDISSLDRGHMSVEVELKMDDNDGDTTTIFSKMRNFRLEEVVPALTNPLDE